MSGSLISGSILSYGAASVNATVATVMVKGTELHSRSESLTESEGLNFLLSIGMLEYSLLALSVVGVLIRIVFDVTGFLSRRRERKR